MPGLPEGFRVIEPKKSSLPEGFRVVAPAAEGFDLVKTLGDAATSFQAGANQGITLGFGDEIFAGGVAPFRAIGGLFDGSGYDIGRAYNDTLGETRERIAADQGLNPIAATAGDVVGSLATGGTLAKGGLTLMNAAQPTIRSLLGRGAAEGAAYGGVSGFGRSEGDSVEERLLDASGDAITGGLLGGAIGGGAGALASRAARKSIPSAADIKAQGSAGYQAAENAGVSVRPQASSLLASDLRALLDKQGLILPNGKLRQGMGRLKGALSQLDQFTSSPMTMAQFQRLREAFQEVARSPKDGQARIGSTMVEKLDEFMESLPQTAFSGTGSGTDAAAAWAQAKTDWARGKRTQSIEDAVYNARMSPEGDFATRLRSQVGSILKRHRKRGLGFSASEIEAMEKFVEGGAIGELMRTLASGGGIPSGVLGGLTGGPAGAVAGWGSALGSKLLMDRGARAAADKLRGQVSGSQPTVSNASKGVTQGLIAATGEQAHRVPIDIVVRGGRT